VSERQPRGAALSWRRMTAHQKLDELHRQLRELRGTMVTMNSNLVTGLGTVFETVKQIEEQISRGRKPGRE